MTLVRRIGIWTSIAALLIGATALRLNPAVAASPSLLAQGTAPPVDAQTLWCPMHPDVRASAPGQCPRCGMALVPIPPPVFGEARLEVSYAAASPTRGRLTLRLRDATTNAPLTSLLTVHDKLLHLFIVSRDLAFFDHVHPATTGAGTFSTNVTLPGPGTYWLYADFAPATGTPQFLHAQLVTPDYRGSPLPPRLQLEPNIGEPQSTSRTRVALSSVTPAPAAGQETTIEFTLTDVKTGSPVTDLEPYLAAPGHLLVVSSDGTDAFHSHPSDRPTEGPILLFHTTFPRAGMYKLWLQFQRGGRVETVSFVLGVRRG